uniref:Reverse transcriptase zinc-binding domain-containing protein n=1 Tax=Micrurus paraensis TaxID=1970185 RepID=A0A2D4L1W9_9SAUR
MWNQNYKLTKLSAYKENAYKMFYRWYLPPSRLAKMYPNMNLIRWKCKKKKSIFYHMWWSCPDTQKYWLKIKKWLQEITKVQIELEPELFLLGIFKKKYGRNIKYIILHILMATRIAYAQCWKHSSIPPDELVIQKIMTCAKMDKLTLMLKEREETKYYKIWGKWRDWIEQR